ncbi:MAG: SPOR domain-containing protein [Candidatus Acidiferrales bacterium]
MDCSKFDYATGCKSFNELLTAGDEATLEELGRTQQEVARVCFVEDPSLADTFYILSVHVPPDSFKGHVKYLAFADLYRYENGVSENAFDILINWVFSGGELTAVGGDRLDPDGSFSITPQQTEWLITYPNVSDSRTHEDLKIMLSTGRFTVSFSAFKNEKLVLGSESFSEGHCIRYQGGAISESEAIPGQAVPLASAASGSVMATVPNHYIWVGRFEQEDRAQNVSERIEAQNLPVAIKPMRDAKGQELFVVLTGPYQQAEAQKVLAWLKGVGFPEARQVMPGQNQDQAKKQGNSTN